jgi:CubicO group peptidase (beta-lactamase class C family)
MRDTAIHKGDAFPSRSGRGAARPVPTHGDLGDGLMPFMKKMLGEIETGELRGVQAYVSRRGRPLLNAGLGWAYEGVPMRADTLTHWLCCTKPLIAILLAQLEEEGALDVDRPVASYWPEFAANGKAAITLRMLLDHTSGMLGDPAEEFLFCSASHAADAIARAPADVSEPPSNRARYLQFSAWEALGEVIRRVTGGPVALRLAEKVFAPLGLRDSHLGLSLASYDAYGERIARIHMAGRGLPEECSFLNWREAAGYEWPGFAARGPAHELGRVFESLLGFGPSILEPATIQRFTASSRGKVYDHGLQEAIDWGLGFVTCPSFFGCRAPANRVFGHNGLGSSFALAAPELDLVVVWVSNVVAEPVAHRTRARRIMATLLDCPVVSEALA